jgi:hypothetical protein
MYEKSRNVFAGQSIASGWLPASVGAEELAKVVSHEQRAPHLISPFNQWFSSFGFRPLVSPSCCNTSGYIGICRKLGIKRIKENQTAASFATSTQEAGKPSQSGRQKMLRNAKVRASWGNQHQSAKNQQSNIGQTVFDNAENVLLFDFDRPSICRRAFAYSTARKDGAPPSHSHRNCAQ